VKTKPILLHAAFVKLWAFGVIESSMEEDRALEIAFDAKEEGMTAGEKIETWGGKLGMVI
jgi:hypothetical protein